MSADISAETLTGKQIVERVEQLLWSDSLEGQYDMTITTPYWSRTLKMHLWMERPVKSFIRILSPKKEAGIGSLRINNEMWNYLPKVERTFKVPPSMMLQPWMGSDFSNDDLVKESSIIHDYNHRLITDKNTPNSSVLFIESKPKPDAAVVAGKLVYQVQKKDLIPLTLEYYDERGRLIKTLTFSDVKKMNGRHVPTLWVMQSTEKPENHTSIKVNQSEYIYLRARHGSHFRNHNIRINNLHCGQ